MYHQNMNELAVHMVRYITANYADITSLDDVARHFSISSSTASRYIKETTGSNFSEYINGLRLEYAAHDLITTNRDIADISTSNGFSSTSVFSRTFKTAYGMSPRDYRKRNAIDTSHQVKRQIRITAEAKAHTPACSLNVSIGSIATAGVPGFISHVLSLLDRFQFNHVRIYNLFSDFVYQRNRQYERRNHPYDGYEFTFVDGLFDELVRRGITVDVELSNRSWSIAQTATQDVVSVSQRPAFESLQQVRQAAVTLVRHWKRRYTAERLRNWSFDLWYDPSLSDITDYVTLLRDLRAELHDILPECMVGGCTLFPSQERRHFTESVEILARYRFTPDFVSIGSHAHALLTETQILDDRTMPRSAAAHSLRQDIMQAQSILSSNGINCPLRIYSWDPVPSQRNRYNDSSEKASMMLQELTACTDLPVTITYNSLTDFSSLYSDVDTPFFGGTGLVNKDGFPKPSLYAILFLKALSPHVIAQGEGYICARDDDRSYTLLLWNRTGLNQQFTHAKEYELTMQQIKLMYQPEHGADCTIEFLNMPRNRYLMREYLVDDERGNGVAACERHTVDNLLPVEDQPFIRADSLPQHTAYKLTTTNGALRFHVHLAPHGFALVRLTEL